LSDIILPLPEDLVANLQDSRKVIDSLLDSLPSMFPASSAAASMQPGGAAMTPNQTASCLGSALAVAKHVLEPTGGKVILFQTVLPTYGDGALKQRDNPRLLGTDKEHTLLNSEDTFYRNMALDFNKLQIAAEVFLFASSYIDIATLGQLAKYTGGQVFYYPAYYALRDEKVFQTDLQRVLTRATAFEAVMRVRATRGLRITNFYGNYFIRGTDLLALPNCNTDSCFGVDIAYDEPVLQAQIICIQAALLYTSSSGERKIRVHNLVLPVTATSSEMMESCDMDAMMNLLSKQAIEVAMKAGLDTARTRIHQTAIDILKSLRTPVPSMAGHGYGAPNQAPQGELLVPAALQLLPLYAMALQKSVILRGGNDIRPDERAAYFQRISNADVSITKTFIYPRLFSIHDAGTDVGLPTDVNLLEETNPADVVLTAGPLRIRLPTLLNLSAERLLSDGIYLLENSMELLLWVGKHVPPVTLLSLFGMATFDGIDMSTVAIQPEASEFAQRMQAVLLALQSERIRAMQVHVIREGDGYAEAYFSRFLIEDR
jgi:protein transport protein SEC24